MDLMVESLEGDIYLAYQVFDEKKLPLADAHNNPIVFRSLNQIRDYCDGMPYQSALLRHNSAYDEMCGLSSGSTVMHIDLNWS